MILYVVHRNDKKTGTVRRKAGKQMSKVKVTEAIWYAGVEDRDIDLFESQYPVPEGVTYNSYVILDEKIAVMDTVDVRRTAQWLANVEEILDGRKPDYLVVSHMEPDHAGSIDAIAEKYPDMEIVGNAKTFAYMAQFFPGMNLEGRKVIVAEGTELSLGEHILKFVMAPMVHWPEVMVTYEEKEKVLFSADGFGRFGLLERTQNWEDLARRYYLNIVGKYGPQVQALLKKAAGLHIEKICPLHGEVLKGDLTPYLAKYQTWSSYQPEEKGVAIFYASVYGNTGKAAEYLAEKLQEAGEEIIVVTDLSRVDVSVAVERAFRYDRLVLASVTYDGGLFPPMETFLNHLKSKAFQNRTIALMENGTWAPMAAKCMAQSLESMKNIRILKPESVCAGAEKAINQAAEKLAWVTIRSSMNEKNREEIRQLAAALI